jgi:hypothetical protein
VIVASGVPRDAGWTGRSSGISCGARCVRSAEARRPSALASAALKSPVAMTGRSGDRMSE